MNILFPVETLSREFDYKLILAHRVIQKFPEAQAFIGSVSAIHNHVKDFKHGVYFGKTIFPSTNQKINISWFNKFKNNGFDFVYLHEEGAVWFGDEDEWSKNMTFQYDINLFTKDDVLCVWGETQRKLESQRNRNNVPIVVTGSPRFELGSQYSFLFNQRVKGLKNKYKDFILINGNFGLSNHGDGFDKMFSYISQKAKTYNDNLNYFIDRYISSNNRMLRMCQLVLIAADKYPDTNFIYRPHPSEHLSSYYDIFRGKKNIIVERRGAVLEYILASKGMIHDGCTTSLDAVTTNIPILNYKIVNDDFDIFLPNQIGEMATDVDSAIRYIGLMLNETKTYQTKSYSTKAANLLYNLNHDDSFDKCEEILNDKIKSKINHNLIDSKAPSISKLRRNSYYRIIKINLATIKNKLINEQNKLSRDKYLLNKYGSIKKKEFEYKLNLLIKYHKATVKGKYITNKIFHLGR